MELAVSPKAHPDYTLKEGVLRYKGRVWVGNNTTAQQHILIAMHDIVVLGVTQGSVLHMQELSNCLLGPI